MSRPELTGHASSYYNQKEARKYDSSSRMIGIQREITDRAIELLRLDGNNNNNNNNNKPSYVLDIGCGSGLSGQVLEERGHIWVGCDISRDMLMMAKERMDIQRGEGDDNKTLLLKKGNQQKSQSNENAMEQDQDGEESDNEDLGASTGDLLHHDMGTGLPFRPATFDACISISALQWLCYSNTAQQNPKRRLTRFFSSLYSVLKRGGRAVLQFYPETAEQAVLISETATRVGFSGGVVVDYPNSAKAKKHYLVLGFDRNSNQAAKQQQQQQQNNWTSTPAGAPQQRHVKVSDERLSKNKKQIPIRKKKGCKTKEWILHKKDAQRQKGKETRPDTKYTARRRPTKF